MGNENNNTSQTSSKQIKLSRSRNAIRNMGAGVLNKIVTLLLPFVLRTVLIKKIGIDYAGLNGLFSSILQVLNLSELGFASAVVYSMYKPISENDKETICALLNFYRKAYFVIGLVILALGVAVIPFLPYLISGDIPSDVNIYILYAIFLLNTSISYLLFGYKQSLFNAYQRQDVLSNILTITTAVMNIVQIVVLCTAKSYYAYILMMPIFTVANNIIVALETKRKFPEYSCRGKLTAEMKKDIRIKVVGLMISKICQTSRTSLDNIFISAFLGLTITAIYSNYCLISTAVTGFLGIITSSMLSGIGNSIQTETKEKNYSDMVRFQFLYAWISGWATICMICLYQPFMELWLGKENLFPFSVVVLLCVYFYICKLGDMTSLYYNGIGIWWENRFRYGLESIANLVLNFLLVKFFGIHGIILATILTIVFIGHVMGNQILFKNYFHNGKLLEYIFVHQMRYWLITTAVCAATFFVCNLIKISSENLILRILVNFSVCIFIPNILYFLFFFKTKLFLDSKYYMLNLLGKKK